jgi:hypothetical protein
LEFVSSVVGLGELIVGGTDLLTLAVILALSISVELTEALDLIKVLCLFLLKLGDFEKKVVDVFAKLIALVRLLGNVTLKARDVNLFACNLVAGSSQVLLHISYNAALLVQEETEVIHFLFQADYSNCIGIVLHSELVVLQQLYF